MYIVYNISLFILGSFFGGYYVDINTPYHRVSGIGCFFSFGKVADRYTPDSHS